MLRSGDRACVSVEEEMADERDSTGEARLLWWGRVSVCGAGYGRGRGHGRRERERERARERERLNEFVWMSSNLLTCVYSTAELEANQTKISQRANTTFLRHLLFCSRSEKLAAFVPSCGRVGNSLFLHSTVLGSNLVRPNV